MCLAIKKINRTMSLLAAIMLFLLLLLEPGASLSGAINGLSLCVGTIIPSLFPFFVVSALLSSMGIPSHLGNVCAPLMSRIFSVSGIGATAFVLGLSGGYPLGAATVSEIFLNGDISKDEAGHLLTFCNNSGPAFIVGAAGIGVFGSQSAGLLLYITHALAAVFVGVLFSPKDNISSIPSGLTPQNTISFAQAFPSCIKSGVTSILTVSGFVVFFSAIVSTLDSVGIFMSFAGGISLRTGADISAVRALLTGILELGSGIGAMNGIPLRPAALALAGFILGWGGISVHFQTMAVIKDSGLSLTRYFSGKLLHGLISALLAFTAGIVMQSVLFI